MEETLKRAAVGGSTATTKDLKRVLGFGDLMSAAVGQIIGSGIMSLTGVAIAMCGRAVPIAFIVSAVITILLAIPKILLCGTVRLRGGEYTMTAVLAGRKYAGVFVILHVCQNISLAMYSLSFADYFLAFLPDGNRKLIAIVCLTTFFLLNLFGIDKMAKAQNAIVAMMCIALGLFAAYGVTEIKPSYFNPQGFFERGGVVGMMSAAALLTFATGGAGSIVNLGAEAKNPTRDLPLVIIVATFFVSIIYAFMAIVAAGVLPIDQVANQSLKLVANVVLPEPLYVFFIVGGCMCALISTLNSQMAWATKPVIQACVDGWFPGKLGAVNKKFRTPHFLLIILYALGMSTIIFGFDVGIIGSLTVIINQVILLFVNISIIRLPKVLPEQWKKSKFRISDGMLKVVLVATVLTNFLNIWLLGKDLSIPMLIGNAVVLILAFAYSIAREKSGKVHMEISYEDQ